MTMRERFLDHIRNGEGRPFVSLRIGAGAGFDTKLAGKEWASETTVEDLPAAGGPALVLLGLMLSAAGACHSARRRRRADAPR